MSQDVEALRRIEEQLEAARVWEHTARANGEDYQRLKEQLEATQRRLRVNSIAWHTKFHEGDWETCRNTACTNDHPVLGRFGPDPTDMPSDRR